MYEGYLSFGGNELLNSARTAGYTSTSGCGVSWLNCPPCEGLADALEDDPYSYDNIEEAPWYDVEDETTHRFLGVHGIRVEGITESTRTAEVSESIGDGGVVSKPRHATRRVRVEALLTAQGEDALEYGLAWLNAALIPRQCSAHGASCGAADVKFFTACPPGSDEVTRPEVVWNDPVTNLYPNPSLEGAAVPAGATISTEWAARGTHSLQVPALGFVDVVTLVDQTFLVTPRNAGQIVRLGGVDTVTSALVPVRLHGSALVQLGEGWWDEILVIAGDYTGPYFDGSTANSTETELETIGALVAEHHWVGAADASASVRTTGTVIGVVDPTGWQEAVDKLTRYMHTSTAVSGPTIVQKLHRGEVWGYIVEFVLVSAVPWTFGPTRFIPSGSDPSLPEIIQDVPFNLVPYPSAEIAEGNVLVSTNWSANPSVEINTTGWTFNVSSPVQLADVFFMHANIFAGGIASDGTRSVQARFIPFNTAAGGVIRIRHTSADFPPAVAGQRMSVNMWAAALVTSGTVVIGDLSFSVTWYAGVTQLRNDVIGSVPPAGGAASMKGIAVPVGATSAVLTAAVTLTSWVVGAAMDFYADAAAITSP